MGNGTVRRRLTINHQPFPTAPQPSWSTIRMDQPLVTLYDTTLRDGSQGEGISFSLHDKLKIAKKLDEIGIHYIEGGWPGSNPKDVAFFAEARHLRLERAK